jgi:hypothetical protein
MLVTDDGESTSRLSSAGKKVPKQFQIAGYFQTYLGTVTFHILRDTDSK